MKRYIIFPLALLSLIFTSCEKDPDTDKLYDDYLVLTNYDNSANFEEPTTFYVIDSILIIDNKNETTYWKNSNSKKIIDAYNENFLARGYTEVESTDDADMVLQLSYINTTYYFNNSVGPWWGSYPGYWNWGGWGWYYPFTFYYAYSTGSIIGELVNTTTPLADNKLPVIWNSYICGLLTGGNLSYSRTMAAIKQAFEQSPYIKK